MDQLEDAHKALRDQLWDVAYAHHRDIRIRPERNGLDAPLRSGSAIEKCLEAPRFDADPSRTCCRRWGLKDIKRRKRADMSIVFNDPDRPNFASGDPLEAGKRGLLGKCEGSDAPLNQYFEMTLLR